MNKVIKVVVVLVVGCGLVGLIAYLLQAQPLAVLDPKGVIASGQRHLIMITVLLMLLVTIPVFIMTFAIAWKYRASNTNAAYSPDWDHNRVAETLWWGIPCVVIGILAVITWKSSHDLDPFKPLASYNQPITVQVVAMQWKWLFIYPQQQIATVNYVQFPANTPVNFEITADAPMNSFWIPQLGGQIYAMAGMETQLHLMASKPGVFRGSSANLSGAGFANMRFEAKASTKNDFDRWVTTVKGARAILDNQEYEKLAKPSQPKLATYYAASDAGLFDAVIMKYMMPGTISDHMQMHHQMGPQ